jgi:hypothetical protein
VAHRGQQLGALADVAQDAVPHQVERVRRLADFQRALQAHVAHVPALAEALGGARQAADGPDLEPQEVERQRRERQRRADHPGEQEPRGRAGHPLPAASTRSSASSSWT